MGRRVLSIELPLLLLTLVVAELGEVVRELRTDVVLDWFVSLAPLIWIDASILALYAFVRLYRSPELSSSQGRPASRARNLFVPDLRLLHESAGGLRRWWAAAAVAYAIVYVILQGMLAVDLSGTIEPGSAVIESPVGYGPGLVWAPTNTFGLVLRPYSIATAVALSLLSGLVVVLSLRVVSASRKAASGLTSPLLGFAVMCPACVGAPVSGLFLAYAVPFASMGGFATASAFSLMLEASTAILIGTLLILWIVLSFLSNVVLPSVPGGARGP